MEKQRNIKPDLEATISRCFMKLQNEDEVVDPIKDIEKPKAAVEGFDFSTNFPESIVDQIFLRVPSKDLARSAKYVSKNWFSLVTRPLFILSKLQLEWPPLSLTSDCFSSPQLLTIIQNGHDLDFSLQKPDLEKETRTLEWKTSNLITFKGSLISPSPSAKPFRFNFEVEVSCFHGLICFHNSSRSVYISNPLTGEFFTAPKPAVHNRTGCEEIIATGFGFCPLLNKYKIVHVCFCWCSHSISQSRNRLNTLRGEVCTAGHDTSWRNVQRSQGPRYPLLPDGKALIIENVMYWFTSPHLTKTPHTKNLDKRFDDLVTPLITFDITTEVFGEILVPIPRWKHMREVDLIELEGKLCIIKRIPNIMTSFWLPKDMTKLEEADNWFIKCKFKFFVPNRFGDYLGEVPIGIIAKIYVMRVDGNQMLYYDCRTGKFLGSHIIDRPVNTFKSVPIPYVPSLVSIVSP